MARKNTPQPLTIVDDTNSTTVVADHYSPLSPTTPKSPRSPFAKFSSGRKLQKERDQDKPPMQSEPAQQVRSIPPSQTTPSLTSTAPPSQSQPQQQQDRQERPPKSGFFSNYKAAKSASRLQQQTSQSSTQAQDSSMSRDNNDRTGVGHVSSRDKTRSGK